MTISGREDWEIIPHKWTQAELDYLVTNYHALPIENIARELNRSIKAVYSQIRMIQRRGSLDAMRGSTAENAHNACRKWTDEENTILGQRISEGKSVAEIAAELQRTRSSVARHWYEYYHETRIRCGYNSNLNDSEKEELRKLIREGKSSTEILLLTGHNYATIGRARERMKQEEKHDTD